MSSSYADEGLLPFWQAPWNGSDILPIQALLISSSFVPGPALKYADLDFSDHALAVDVFGHWLFNLDTITHLVTATQKVVFTFDASRAGETYYGVALVSIDDALLFFTEIFPGAYIVPAGGASLPYIFRQTFSDCTAAPIL